ncbi:hypothetical protein ABBQ32_007157 [Trebouxia sp. C0010 RCD-2024]
MSAAKSSLAAIVSLFQSIAFRLLCLSNVKVSGLPNSFCSTEQHHLLKFFAVYGEPDLVVKSHLLTGSACGDLGMSSRERQSVADSKKIRLWRSWSRSYTMFRILILNS